MNAERLATKIDAVDAIAHADAGAYLMLAAFHHFAGDMGIGHVGAGHADHIEFAGCNRMAGGCDVLNAGCMKDGELRSGANVTREIKAGRRPRAHAGDDMRERFIRIDMAFDDVQKINLACGDKVLGNSDAVIAGQSTLPILVAHQTGTDDEIRADAVPHGVNHLAGKAQPIIERAAIGVDALVGGRRPELVDQMAIHFEFETIEPARLAPLGGIGVIADDAGNVPFLDGFRKCAVRLLANS